MPPHRRTTVAAQRPSGCQIVPSAPVSDERSVAGRRAFLDEQLAHRHHFPIDLVALGAPIVVEAGLRIGVDLLDGERAALHPGVAQLGHVGRPVEAQRRLDLGRRAVEAGGDVLLAVGYEVGLGVLGVDRDVHAEPQSRGFRDVLDQLHLRAVEAHAVDVGAGRRGLRRDGRRHAVDQRVLAALRRVDELEAVQRIGAREGAEMVADRIVVAVVPVPDRGQHAVRVEIDRIGAAAQLRRQQRDPVAEALPADIGPAVHDLAHDARRLGVVGAGMLQAVVRHRAAAQGVVSDHRGLGGGRGADRDVEHRAPAHPAGLGGRGRDGGLGLARVGFLLLGQVGLEFGVVLFLDLGAPLDEVGCGTLGRKLSAL